MTTPLIGITSSRKLNAKGLPIIFVMEAYIQAISRAGAVPVIVPLGLPEEGLQNILPRLDGILFSGGGDIAPERFNGDEHPAVSEVDADRDRVEIHLAQAAAQQGMPFLGICRGIQVVNVALGGTLYTHISDQLPGALKHNYYPDIPRDYLAHSVRVESDSRLGMILGGCEFEVNSLHHQGIETPAPGLSITAHAPDGLIEAVELPDHPFGLAVQWHPEWLQAYETMRALFGAFVKAAGNVKRNA